MALQFATQEPRLRRETAHLPQFPKPGRAGTYSVSTV